MSSDRVSQGIPSRSIFAHVHLVFPDGFRWLSMVVVNSLDLVSVLWSETNSKMAAFACGSTLSYFEDKIQNVRRIGGLALVVDKIR